MQDAAVGRCDHQFQHPARRARAGRRVALPLADRPTAEAEHFQRTLDALRIGCVDARGGVRIDARQFGMQRRPRSEEHTSELQSLMRISYAVFCLKQKKTKYELTTG